MEKKRATQEEVAICRAFVLAYDKHFGARVTRVRRGKPPEPDFVCDSSIGIEVTTVYEGQAMGKWQNAPGQPDISPLMANPIASMRGELARLIEQKSRKTYDKAGELMLVLWVKAVFSRHEVWESAQKRLSLRKAGPFTGVWVGCPKDNGCVFFSLFGPKWAHPARIEYP